VSIANLLRSRVLSNTGYPRTRRLLFFFGGVLSLNTHQLIGPKDLNKQLDNLDLRIIDCRFDLSDPSAGRRDYEAACIPGAVFLDLNEDLASSPGEGTGRHPLPAVARISSTVGRLGIDNSTPVVVYDGGNGAMAARAWWILRWLGHNDVRLLDGGISAWKASRFALSSDVVVPKPVEFVARVRDELVITSREISENANGIESLNLLDARDAGRFAGAYEPIDKVAGHVPGARNLPFPESLNADGSWKDRDELGELWSTYLGGSRQTEWVAMCGSGVTACHLALSAIEAGYKEPRLYVGSWSEWIADPSRPIGR
jgi:thiosulfate/3-mercaptopyruvate sulfurtransferase